MKNKILIILVIAIILIVGATIFIITENQIKENKTSNSSTDYIENEEKISDNIVVIKNNKITNESLIDDFIEKAVDTNVENQELCILQDNLNIKVTYTPGEYAKIYQQSKENENISMPIGDGSTESNKKIYGYYSLFINDELKGEYPLISHTIKRDTTDNNVTLYFDAMLINYSTIPEICKYSLESSNYEKKYDLLYDQRKDMGIKNIYDAGEYLVKTFGGDVSITIEGDMVYTLEDALNKKIITPDDIINQAKMDLKYGICQENYYQDGGSTEYCYYDKPQYTILKLNTLDNDRDLIIGMSGQIINAYKKYN